MELGQKSTWKRLTTQTSLTEVFRSIPDRWIHFCLFALLCALTLLPLIVLLFDASSDGYTMRYSVLYAAMRGVGYFGLLVSGISALRRYYASPRAPFRVAWFLSLHGLWFFLLLMLFWSILATVFSTHPSTSFFGDAYRLDGLVSYFGYAGIFAAAFQFRKRKYIWILLNIFVASASVLALLGWLNLRMLNIRLWITPKESIFHNSNHYGYFLCMAAMAAVLLLVCVRMLVQSRFMQWILTVLYGVELALLGNGLVQCRTVGTLLAVVLALVALLILFLFAHRKFLPRLLLACLILIVSVGWSSVGKWDLVAEGRKLTAAYGTMSRVMAGEEVDQEEVDRLGTGRGKLVALGIRYATERPWFGYGPDNLGARYRVDEITYNDRPHNEVVQFAASLGFPAAVFYLLAMGCHLWLFIKRFRRLDPMILCAYGIVGAYLISSLFGNTMYYTTPYFMMLLGMSGALIRGKEGT